MCIRDRYKAGSSVETLKKTLGLNMVEEIQKIDLQRIIEADTAVDIFMEKVRQSTINMKKKLEDQWT